MAALRETWYSPQEYLRLERMGKEKHEYHNGRIYAMAGATPNHVRVTRNVLTSLHVQLRGKSCEAFGNDQRVQVDASGLYTYPDVSVVCGEPRYDPFEPDNLLNPIVLVEVLSTTTEGYDRGDKFRMYRTIPTFREYVLVAQDKAWVERYFKDEDGEWRLTSVEGLEAVLELRTLPCTLALAEVYEGVAFEQAERPPGSELSDQSS
jgi:Uma2 family endonuclease